MLPKIILVTAFTVFALCLGAPSSTFKKKNSRDNIDAYIVGGDIVRGREFPSQVSFMKSNKHVCSGSILSPEVILTAAQCLLFDWTSLVVTEGSNYLNDGTTHSLDSVEFHEDFNLKPMHDDIALVKVSPPIELGNNSDVAKLPMKGQETPTGTTATLVGWGSITGSPGFINDLRQADLEIVDHKACEDQYLALNFTIRDTHICANSVDGSKAACYGDVGAPLFVNKEIVAMMSTGKTCHTNGFPTVYTEVADYIDWIELHMLSLTLRKK